MNSARDDYRVAAEQTHEVPRALLPGSSYQRPGQIEPFGNTNHAYLHGQDSALCGAEVGTMWRFTRPFANLSPTASCPACQELFDARPTPG